MRFYWHTHCGCEYGGECDKIALCALQNAVEEDAAARVPMIVDALIEAGFIDQDKRDDALEILL